MVGQYDVFPPKSSGGGGGGGGGSVTTGNLTSGGSISVTGGTNAVVGSGTQINVVRGDITSSTGGITVTGGTGAAVGSGTQIELLRGNLTETVSNVLQITGGSGAVIGGGATVQVQRASSSVNGYLSSTDWTTFNNKQAALTAGSAGTYLRGDTFAAATLNQAAVAGLTTTDSPTFASVSVGNTKFVNAGKTVTVSAPTLASNIALTLPSTTGANGQALVTDGSGNTTWSTFAQPTSKNYFGGVKTTGTNGITASDFETGTASGWTLANTSLSSLIPTSVASAGTAFSSSAGGTAASANLSFTVTSTSPLSGVYSGSLSSSAASTAGNCLVSPAFQIDSSDQAKVLQFRFNYKVTSGASALNFSGTSSNSFAVYFYDVTNAQWVQPAGVYNLVQTNGIGQCTGTFQTSNTASYYQLVLVNINASTGAYTLLVDDFFVGPQLSINANAASDWVAYTPTFTGFGTVSASAVYSRRVGDSLEIQGSFTVGTATAVTAQMTLGYNGVNGNVTVDTAKIGAGVLCGDGGRNNNTTTYFRMGLLSPPSNANYINFSLQTSTSNVQVASLGSNVTATAGLIVQFRGRIPIVGWSSNTVMSADTDTRVVAMRAGSTTGASMGTLSGTESTVIYNSVANDTHGALNTTTGIYTIPVTGFYDIAAQYYANLTLTSGNQTVIKIYNATTSTSIHQFWMTAQASVTSGFAIPISAKAIYLTAGTQICIRAAAIGASSSAYATSADSHYFEVARVSGPAVVASTETVACRYMNCATAFADTVYGTPLYSTKDYDTHAAYSTSTGQFTVPVSGKYRVHAVLLMSAGASGVAYWSDYLITKNGSNVALGEITGTTNSVSNNMQAAVQTTIACVAGDVLSLSYGQTSGASRTPTSNTVLNYLTIERIGN